MKVFKFLEIFLFRHLRLRAQGRKTAFLAFVIVGGILFKVGSGSAQEQDNSTEKPSVAVFPLIVSDQVKNQVGGKQIDFSILPTQLSDALRASRNFTVFERSAEILNKSVLSEQEFAQGGRALGDAAKLGKMNNVELIAQLSLTNVSFSINRFESEESPGKYRYSASATVASVLRLIDTTRAQIKFQRTETVSVTLKSADLKNITGEKDDGYVGNAIWLETSKQLASRFSSSISEHLNPIRVISKSKDSYFINRGDGSGIKVGESFQILSKGEDLVDPDTNEVLGEEESLLGEVRVVRVNPRFSVVEPIKPLSNDGKKGDILRRN